HPAADQAGIDPRAHRVHDPARLVAADDRRAGAAEPEARRRVARRTIRMQIAPAHPRRLDRQHHLAGPRRRVGELTHFELTAAQKHDALHDLPPFVRGPNLITWRTLMAALTSPIISEAVRTLVDRRDLSRIEAAAAMEAIMSGAATNAQIAAFLTALRMKGEVVEELIGFAQVMREKVTRIRPHVDQALTGTEREMLIDTCGTGGDASGTFNISTATAFVVAGAGLRVAKHGNRSMSGLTSSSLCGSADVVEALGVNLDLEPAQVTRCVDDLGIGFLYAPLLHTAMKHVMAARREVGIRTV